MSGCPFCPEALEGRIVAESGPVVAFLDGFPVSDGHHLIVPREHVGDFFDLTLNEHREVLELLTELSLKLQSDDPTITGFNIGWNCGASAGQTVFHAHCHLIPRRDGDTPNPRGGVRGVIPGKMSYSGAPRT